MPSTRSTLFLLLVCIFGIKGAAFAADLSDDGYDLSKQRAIIVPQALYLPAAMTDSLLNWVRDDGRLIATGIPGIWTKTTCELCVLNPKTRETREVEIIISASTVIVRISAWLRCSGSRYAIRRRHAPENTSCARRKHCHQHQTVILNLGVCVNFGAAVESYFYYLDEARDSSRTRIGPTRSSQ